MSSSHCGPFTLGRFSLTIAGQYGRFSRTSTCQIIIPLGVSAAFVVLIAYLTPWLHALRSANALAILSFITALCASDSQKLRCRERPTFLRGAQGRSNVNLKGGRDLIHRNPVRNVGSTWARKAVEVKAVEGIASTSTPKLVTVSYLARESIGLLAKALFGFFRISRT
jgi:hypothetical protein